MSLAKANPIPIVDLSEFIARGAEYGREDCVAIAKALEHVGAVIVRDDRLDRRLSSRFTDLMLWYYRQPVEVKERDRRIDLAHQVGWQPAYVETPRRREEERASLPEGQQPSPWNGEDPKERFSIPIGERPKARETEYPEINLGEIQVAHAPEDWEEVTKSWGNSMLETIRSVTNMAVIGFGEHDADQFVDLLDKGPHLLAPTGTDLSIAWKSGTPFAGFHTDMCFMTGHSASNYPGLFVWTRNGQKIPVRVPDGCLFLQAGKQFQYCTGGRVLAGYHEVIAVPEMLEKRERELEKGLHPYRVSLTLFAHVASDKWLKPCGMFATPGALERCQPIKAGDRVRNKLQARGIMKVGAA